MDKSVTEEGSAQLGDERTGAVAAHEFKLQLDESLRLSHVLRFYAWFSLLVFTILFFFEDEPFMCKNWTFAGIQKKIQCFLLIPIKINLINKNNQLKLVLTIKNSIACFLDEFKYIIYCNSVTKIFSSINFILFWKFKNIN